MTNKEAIKYLIVPTATSTQPGAEYLKQKEAYKLAIKALEERPQGDLISREGIIRQINNLFSLHDSCELDEVCRDFYEEVIEAIQKAPTVDVISNEEGYEMYGKGYLQGYERCKGEKPKGEWIRYRDEPHQPEHIKCSNCGQYWSIADHDKTFNFCFKCGADMRKGSTESLDYQRAVEDAEYCERYEPTYNPNDGSM